MTLLFMFLLKIEIYVDSCGVPILVVVGVQAVVGSDARRFVELEFEPGNVAHKVEVEAVALVQTVEWLHRHIRPK